MGIPNNITRIFIYIYLTRQLYKKDDYQQKYHVMQLFSIHASLW